MVDPIGAKPSVAGDRAVVRVTAATPSSMAQTPVRAETPVRTPLLPESVILARSMAAAPPVDASRVAEIKKAIASGNFPILPATIADRLMALKLSWNSNETA